MVLFFCVCMFFAVDAFQTLLILYFSYLPTGPVFVNIKSYPSQSMIDALDSSSHACPALWVAKDRENKMVKQLIII